MNILEKIDEKKTDEPAGFEDDFLLSDSESGVPTESEDFDPFQVGQSALKINNDAATLPKKDHTTLDAASVNTRGSTALPPKLLIKFKIHEEVSSVALTDNENEGSSDVFVEGTVLVSGRNFALFS